MASVSIGSSVVSGVIKSSSVVGLVVESVSSAREELLLGMKPCVQAEGLAASDAVGNGSYIYRQGGIAGNL